MASKARTRAACLASAFGPMDALCLLAGRDPIEPARPIMAQVITATPELDRITAEARAELGEARWAELNAGWE